jgi:hypothetical protein
MRIAFDIDEVICSVDGELRTWFLDRLGYDIHAGKTFQIAIPGWTESDIWVEITRFLMCHADSFNPIEDAINELPWFYNFNKGPLPFVTARPPEVKSQTANWLKKYVPVPHTLELSNNGSKVKYLKNVDYYVDDRIKNTNEAAPFLLNAFLLKKRWSAERNSELLPNVVPVTNLLEVKEFIMEQEV